MKIDRRALGYLSVVIVAAVCFAAIRAEQWVLTGLIVILWLAFVFGIDKIVLDLKNKKVEVDNADED